MVQPRLKSKSFRKVKKRVPGGRLAMHFVRKQPSLPACSTCRKPLHGVAKGRGYQVSKLSKSQKRPSRPYGGNLCSGCMRSLIKEKALALLAKQA